MILVKLKIAWIKLLTNFDAWKIELKVNEAKAKGYESILLDNIYPPRVEWILNAKGYKTNRIFGKLKIQTEKEKENDID